MDATTENIWGMVREVRSRCAEMLAELTPEQWEAPSLCSGWRVRDVVAHQAMEIGLTKIFVPLVRAGFRVHTVSARLAREHADLVTADELLEAYRRLVASRERPFRLAPSYLLLDAYVHTGDIRRPLGLPLANPSRKTLLTIANLAVGARPLGGPKRSAGLRLRGSDMDWSHGEGPEIVGPMEALILAVTGRPAALEDLEGEGQPVLAGRL